MFAVRLHRRCVAWMALLAVVVSALMPTLAQALTQTNASDDALMVCTASGVMWVQSHGDALPAEDNTMATDQQQHCSWCSMHAMAALPVTASALPLLACSQEMPVAFYRAGPMPSIWLGALTRAPPALRG